MAAWKCPKCGREYQREEQQHYCVKPKTVDEYIAAQEERVRPRLEELRSLLRETLPDDFPFQVFQFFGEEDTVLFRR